MAAPGRRRFGKTGREVTSVGLGGEGVLRTYGRQAEATAVIREALRAGITYFDSARAYAGSEDYHGAVWRNRPDLRAGVFLAGKSASRLHTDAEMDLQETLRRMGVETLDLWQIHDVRTFPDIREIEGPGGALAAFVEARESGIVRQIGVTGHHDPDVLSHAVENWPVDAVMMPVNPVEEVPGGFLSSTLSAAREQGVAVIGMKVLGGSNYLVPGAGVTAVRPRPGRLRRNRRLFDPRGGAGACRRRAERSFARRRSGGARRSVPSLRTGTRVLPETPVRRTRQSLSCNDICRRSQRTGT